MTFKEIFIDETPDQLIEVPEYQRAYSWEKKQIDLFITDLESHYDREGYYFGHFILEQGNLGWELVDGQQRLTTLVLFLAICQKQTSNENQPLFNLLKRFKTVKYDQAALDKLIDQGVSQPQGRGNKPPTDDEIITALDLVKSEFTVSQKRMVLAALRFQGAFESEELKKDRIPAYIRVISESLCSKHVTYNKAVAVSVFEMHNTRGVALKLIEVIKAKLMRFVYHHGGDDKNRLVSEIQAEFAAIHAMEEKLAVSGFRGEMSMDGIIRHHLRVIDDGQKTKSEDYDMPDKNAGSDKLLDYIDRKLAEQTTSPTSYPLSLAKKLKESVQIVCDYLPQWDTNDNLVGDVMILDRGLSCEFFLIVCGGLAKSGNVNCGPLSESCLRLWEKLLFTHDFHGRYHNLKGSRDDFPKLFSRISQDRNSAAEVIEHYLMKGFREDRTGGDLQKVVREDLEKNEVKDRFLKDAFGWWRNKVIYVLYKYEIWKKADIRRVMKRIISVEHILPQNWEWDWVEKDDCPARKFETEEERDKYRREFGSKVSTFINGLGNLLLVTREDNSALGNEHPAKKNYMRICSGGSYLEHEARREKWKSSDEWQKLIKGRGDEIYKFLLEEMLK